METSRVHQGKLIDFFWYQAGKWEEYHKRSIDALEKLRNGEVVEEFPSLQKHEELFVEWDSLPKPDWSMARSGVSAYHKYCFDRLSDEEKGKNIPSRTDPDQSWGGARKKYM